MRTLVCPSRFRRGERVNRRKLVCCSDVISGYNAAVACGARRLRAKTRRPFPHMGRNSGGKRRILTDNTEYLRRYTHIQ